MRNRWSRAILFPGVVASGSVLNMYFVITKIHSLFTAVMLTLWIVAVVAGAVWLYLKCEKSVYEVFEQKPKKWLVVLAWSSWFGTFAFGIADILGNPKAQFVGTFEFHLAFVDIALSSMCARMVVIDRQIADLELQRSKESPANV